MKIAVVDHFEDYSHNYYTVSDYSNCHDQTISVNIIDLKNKHDGIFEEKNDLCHNMEFFGLFHPWVSSSSIQICK